MDPPSAASLDSPAEEEEEGEEDVGVLLRSPRLSWISRFHTGSGGFCFFFFFFFLFLWSVAVAVVVVVAAVIDGAGAEAAAATDDNSSTTSDDSRDAIFLLDQRDPKYPKTEFYYFKGCLEEIYVSIVSNYCTILITS